MAISIDEETMMYITKQLKVLELLKNIIYIEEDKKLHIGKIRIYFDLLDEKEKEEFELIKEWLNNEQ